MTKKKVVSCPAVLKVLADETRLAVVRQLMGEPKHVGEINTELELDPSLLSHHLKVLREAGLVVSERDGKSVLYSLAPGIQDTPMRINLGCCLLSFE